MHTQNNEEKIILDYFGSDFKGSVLDIGANDGITFSNSRKVITLGWSADLVEPSEEMNNRLMKLYAINMDVCIHNHAISEVDGEIDFYESGTLLNEGDSSLVSTTIPEETERWKKGNISFESKKIKSKTFESFYEVACNKTWDLISIDVEGKDLEVLKQINLKEVECKMLIIEWNGNDYLLKKYEEYCEFFGMRLMTTNPENAIFIRK